MTEEPSQHVRSDSAFASQNLKFAGEMSNDQRLFASLKKPLKQQCIIPIVFNNINT